LKFYSNEIAPDKSSEAFAPLEPGEIFLAPAGTSGAFIETGGKGGAKKLVVNRQSVPLHAAQGELGDDALAGSGHGEGDDFAASSSDSSCHPAPFSGNESRSTGTRQRLRDLNRALLAASGIEARHNLQDGHVRHD
jgi:hypothetical protein